MRRGNGGTGRLDRWPSPRVPALVVVLLLVERLLMDEVGPPLLLLRALLELGDAWSGPVASLLALMALLVEGLAGYVLIVLALRSLCLLPGSVGRLARRFAPLVTPVVVRRLLDLLVGGTLLAQATLAATPGRPPGLRPEVSQLASVDVPRLGTRDVLNPAARDVRPRGSRDVPQLAARDVPPPGSRNVPQLASTASSPQLASMAFSPRRASATGPSPSALVGPAAAAEPGAARGGAAWRRWPVADWTEPARARPTPRRSAVPLPPWLGGGPSKPAPAHTVEEGDTLWAIAAARLMPADRSVANIDRYWRQVYRANRPVIGADPDLIHPGTRLVVPPFRRDRR